MCMFFFFCVFCVLIVYPMVVARNQNPKILCGVYLKPFTVDERALV